MIAFWRNPSAQLCFGLLAAVCLLDAALLQVYPIQIAPGTISGTCDAAILLAVLAFGLWKLSTYLAGQSGPAAKFGSTASLRACYVLTAMIFLVVKAPAVGLFSYLSIAMALPLQDTVLAAIDRALGFDWLATLAWANASSVVATALVWSYKSSVTQVLALTFLLAVLGKPREMWDFLAVLMLSLVITLAISAFMPALAAYHYHQPNPEAYRTLQDIETVAGLGFRPEFLALRDGTFGVFETNLIKGLVTFPSYHTVMALALIVAARGVTHLFWPAVLLNSVVILSTLHVGGHYFVDVIGGALAFVAALVVVDRCNGREAFWARWRRPIVHPQHALP